MSKRYFHFTIGPVQGFVAQARRTRDFWAGSFILSWLAAVAMRAVQQQGGKVEFPLPDPRFMEALVSGDTGPTQATIPNRFKAVVPDDFAAEQVELTVRTAWSALAEHVWKRDLAACSLGMTRTIWERQIGRFWDMQWALVEDKDESSILDRLKNWRTYAPPDEPGVKCMMMDGWQELSGAVRPGRRPTDPKGPEDFWREVRTAGQSGMSTDLRDGEMLCAVAFVKRRFARHFACFEAKMPGDWAVSGWKLPTSVPSVHYMAAAPWLAKLLGVAAAQDTQGREVLSLLGDFHAAAFALTGGHGEWESNIACVRKADGKRHWKALDGTVFFDSMLENSKLWGDVGKQREAREVLRRLKKLRKSAALEPVSPFYAVLMMDGDQLGMHMSNLEKQREITQGLADFTGKVKSIVQAYNGFLVYAGGDDVLALLPMEDALRCAAALRLHYLSCFDAERVPTTLSGAIEYAHVKMPLGKVLQDAHHLLDSVAKEARGRDAIACRVWKPGGLTLEWAMPWDCALVEGRVVIDRLADEFRDSSATEEREMASKFFYRIRERFGLLNPSTDGGEAVLGGEDGLELMAMEYLNSGLVTDKGYGMEQAKERVAPLLRQCRPVVRDIQERDRAKWRTSERLEADGALLVRFLAQRGVDQ